VRREFVPQPDGGSAGTASCAELDRSRVGACSKILEATPAEFNGWESLTDEQLLDSLRPAEKTVEAARAVLQMQIDALRKRGISWASIGEALKISRQAAWERFS